MIHLCLEGKEEEGISQEQIKQAVLKAISEKTYSKVLILPPDITRLNSDAGYITQVLYHELMGKGCHVDIMPALGSHSPMTQEECERMFGDVPFSAFLVHNWWKDTVKIGDVPARYVAKVTDGRWNESLAVEVNTRLLDRSYDRIISVGQVVPHEVAGMANYSKNIFVGCGGSDMISKTHMIGANYGIENIMGRDHAPLREIWDYALREFLPIPVLFILTVTTAPQEQLRVHGLYIGEDRKIFEKAVKKSQQVNIINIDRPIHTCVVYLDPKEFKTIWLGNKAVYRTKLAMADNGRLIILGPAVTRFGEDMENDRLIRKYGYFGRKRIMALYGENEDLRNNLSVTSHLLMGSSEDRYEIIYAAPELGEEAVKSANYSFGDYDALAEKYLLGHAAAGWNRTESQEEFYYIPNPALGLWRCGCR